MHVIPFPVNFIQYYIETNHNSIHDNACFANKQVISGVELFDEINLYKKVCNVDIPYTLLQFQNALVKSLGLKTERHGKNHGEGKKYYFPNNGDDLLNKMKENSLYNTNL